MKNSACPECQAPIGLGTYFLQLWLVRITCPSCKKAVRVAGMGAFYAVSGPPFMALGWLYRRGLAAHGLPKMLGLTGAMLLGATILLVIGLQTWMRLEPDTSGART